MENASKALLIAGAILLAILIISLGLFAYSNARKNVEGNNLDMAQIEAFNLEWQNYIGSRVSATTVESLITKIQSHNQKEFSSGEHNYITVRYNNVNYGPTSDNIATAPTPQPTPSIPANTTYSVNVTAINDNSINLPGYNASGRIRSIVVSDNNAQQQQQQQQQQNP